MLFSARLFGALRALSGDEGARSILRGLGERLVEVPAPDTGILFDVDTPDELDG